MLSFGIRLRYNFTTPSEILRKRQSLSLLVYCTTEESLQIRASFIRPPELQIVSNSYKLINLNFVFVRNDFARKLYNHLMTVSLKSLNANPNISSLITNVAKAQ